MELRQGHRARNDLDAQAHRLHGKGNRIRQSIKAVDRLLERRLPGVVSTRGAIRQRPPRRGTVLEERRNTLYGSALSVWRGELGGHHGIPGDGSARILPRNHALLTEEAPRRIDGRT